MKYLAAFSLLACAASALPSLETKLSVRQGTVGQAILDKALTAKGTPYAWGGGTCDGPSADNPPYQYGDIGYDCSGLVSWAVCQVTGRDLFTEGLRVTSTMYCADEAKLGYKYAMSNVLQNYFTDTVLGNTPWKNASQETPSSSAASVTATLAAASTTLD